MAPKLARGMDPLACLASDEDEDEDEKEEEEEGERNGHTHAPTAAVGAKAPVVDYEALQRAGYRGCVFSQARLDCLVLGSAGCLFDADAPSLVRSGPSVLVVPDKKPEVAQDWNWSRGARPEGGRWRDTAEELEALHHAAGAGVQESIERQLAAAEQAKRLREAAFREELELKQRQQSSKKDLDKDKLTFNQREKRKRERGQATSGKARRSSLSALTLPLGTDTDAVAPTELRGGGETRGPGVRPL